MMNHSSRLLADNWFSLFDDPAAWDAIFTALRPARDTIHIESFIFEEFDFNARLSEMLNEQQRAGVAVRVIYDSFGSLPLTAFD